MMAGLVLSGMLIGALAAGIGLIMGTSIWIALLIYAAIGAAGMLACALIIAYRSPKNSCSDVSAPLARTDT
ncbi:hypothetical protein [Ruegeria arenilitoris]|uniref:hypothetical protein n=1 Tax=Ruegeria arenilitoris TaxID=1173585 RepID=UPI00147A818E|nr:hypothetical protein [Ruegeria arenilitoris]